MGLWDVLTGGAALKYLSGQSHAEKLAKEMRQERKNERDREARVEREAWEVARQRGERDTKRIEEKRIVDAYLTQRKSLLAQGFHENEVAAAFALMLQIQAQGFGEGLPAPETMFNYYLVQRQKGEAFSLGLRKVKAKVIGANAPIEVNPVEWDGQCHHLKAMAEAVERQYPTPKSVTIQPPVTIALAEEFKKENVTKP